MDTDDVLDEAVTTELELEKIALNLFTVGKMFGLFCFIQELDRFSIQ